MISVIVPTFNEEENICELIQHIRSCENGQHVEIIICDAPSSFDKGCEKAGSMGAIAVKSPKAYRAFQMNHGAESASNDILYFLHADARPPRTFIAQILQALKEVDFGIFSYKFNSTSLILKVNAYFTRYDGLFSGGGDQSLFISREKFVEIGGFNNKLRIMEDFEFYKKAKKAKLKFKIIKDPLLVSARKYEQNGWLKVNLTNLRIFFIFLRDGPQDRMITLNQKLTKSQMPLEPKEDKKYKH